MSSKAKVNTTERKAAAIAFLGQVVLTAVSLKTPAQLASLLLASCMYILVCMDGGMDGFDEVRQC